MEERPIRSVPLWRPREVPEKWAKLVNKIVSGRPRLDRFFNIYRGVWTGTRHIFVIPEEVVEQYSIEREALKPIVRGRDIRPFYFSWSKMWIIYPQGEDFPQRCPNAMKWLSRFEMVLKARAAVYIWGRKWWELEDPLSPEEFAPPKLMCPVATNQQTFALDLEGYFCTEGVTILRWWRDESEMRRYFEEWKKVNEPDMNVDEVLDEAVRLQREVGRSLDSMYFFLGLLNSQVIEFVHKQRGQRVQKRSRRPKPGRFWYYTSPWLNVIPVELGSPETRADVARRAREICEIARRFYEAESDEEKQALEEQLTSKVAELDEAIFDMYGLTDEERAMLQRWVLRKR